MADLAVPSGNMLFLVAAAEVGLGSMSERKGGQDTTKKRHRCPYCVYSTARKDHLKKHIRVHTGEKPFACAHCPYRSSQKYNLKSHEFTHKL
ncbi:Zinc finger and SCAN domain-containing protein 5B [Penaeus vannamei]|uniref:Zinc finger and SCAN domain-containing protein 5B n=1 Tax=Penaeus vannamei TaxID=6689 RepID=A0A423U760_PENVA|nr:Zinc finger and SCAN domain-containing protein 5B [Penaeus vannamei]